MTEPSMAPHLGRPVETLLLVEDDPLQATLFSTFLERNGYRVLHTGHAEEALDDAEACAIVSDLNLAGTMSGAELAHELRRRGDERPIVLMSGDVGPRVRFEGSSDSSIVVLEKPFPLNTLIQALETLRHPEDLSQSAERRSA